MVTLRTVRIAVSSLSVMIVTAIFLDITNIIPPSWSSVIFTLQFAPALLKTITIGGFAVVGVLFVSLFTVFFGRIYCSHLCPLGALQDFIIWIMKKNYKHRKFPFQQTNFLIHYLTTILVMISVIGGSAVFLDLFEPFSNYGRMLSVVVRPLIIDVNNVFALGFSSTNMFGIVEIANQKMTVWNIVFPIAFLLMIIGLTVWRGRLFCNLLCPVGGILSVLSRISLYKITIHQHDCIDCGLCERVCRVQCIDSKKRSVDFAACVGCFDCIDSCPTGGMEYTTRSQTELTDKEGADRRTMLLSLSTTLFASTGIQKIADSTKTTSSAYTDAKIKPIVPPGGIAQERFANLCTACHHCINSCPTHVLQSSFLEYGFAGILQPRMDYNISYCNYDCTICGEVCPTGAIQHLLPQAKKLVQLGKVTFVKEDCIVEIKKKDCGACSEHCPTKAVKMVPYENKLFIPQIENEYCVGCGACEHACPTTPRKAIFVTPNSVHGTARKREEKRMEPLLSTPHDFPF